MKKLLTLALTVIMILAMAACGAAKPKVVTCGVDFDVPEGFNVSADNDAMWFAPNYPEDSSNINVMTSEKDPSFKIYTSEILSAAIEKQFKSQYDIDVDCQADSFERITIDGYDAIRCEYTYSVNGIDFHQIQYMINGDEAYTVTYTIVNSADWADAFKTSGDSIKVLTKDA